MALLPQLLLVVVFVGTALASDAEVQALADELVSQAETAAGSLLKAAASKPGKKAVVKAFTHEHCDCDKSLIKLSDIDVVSLPDGHVVVTGTADVEEDIHEISGSVKMEFNKGGSSRPVPCVNQIGCCDYPDLCSVLEKLNKPSLKCPILKGTYKLPEELKIDISKFSRILNSHSFNITAKAFSGGHNCLCSNINITFE